MSQSREIDCTLPEAYIWQDVILEEAGCCCEQKPGWHEPGFEGGRRKDGLAFNDSIAEKDKAAWQLHHKESLQERGRADHLQERNKALEAELAALKANRPNTPVMDARRDVSFNEELGDLQGTINVLRPRYLALLHSHPNPAHALAFLPQDQQASFAEVLNLPAAEYNTSPAGVIVALVACASTQRV